MSVTPNSLYTPREEFLESFSWNPVAAFVFKSKIEQLESGTELVFRSKVNQSTKWILQIARSHSMKENTNQNANTNQRQNPNQGSSSTTNKPGQGSVTDKGTSTSSTGSQQYDQGQSSGQQKSSTNK